MGFVSGVAESHKYQLLSYDHGSMRESTGVAHQPIPLVKPWFS